GRGAGLPCTRWKRSSGRRRSATRRWGNRPLPAGITPHFPFSSSTTGSSIRSCTAETGARASGPGPPRPPSSFAGGDDLVQIVGGAVDAHQVGILQAVVVVDGNRLVLTLVCEH